MMSNPKRELFWVLQLSPRSPSAINPPTAVFAPESLNPKALSLIQDSVVGPKMEGFDCWFCGCRVQG